MSRATRLSVPVALMQSPLQAETTIQELRARMGEEAGLLSYLPNEKVQAAPFQNAGATGDHFFPVRIMFGKIKGTRASRDVWILLSNKPGSKRPPEYRLKLFSLTGEAEESITLEDAMEKVSLTTAFTCLETQKGRFDRAHLNSVLRYYFILQKVVLASPWHINELFISDLKAACRFAKANLENGKLPIDLETGTAASAQAGDDARSQKPPRSVSAREAVSSAIRPGKSTLIPCEPSMFYTFSHKAIKSSRAGSTVHRTADNQSRLIAPKRSDASVSPAKRRHHEDMKPSLEEALFGEAAEALLLAQSDAAAAATLAMPSPSRTLPFGVEVTSVSPEDFIASYRRNVIGDEDKKSRLVKNKQTQAALRRELENLEQEAEILETELLLSKAERKQLRTSLSTRDLAFLQAGQDLAHGGSKRLRFIDSEDDD